MMLNLLWLFIIPWIASIVVFCFPFNSQTALRRLSLFSSFIPLVYLIYGGANWIGAHFTYPWFASLSINFELQIDSLSLIFVYMTAIITPIALAVVSTSTPHPKVFYGLILLLEGLLIGFFTTQDLVFFAIFWEAILIPLFFLINLGGGSGRFIASIRFLIYMIAGSSLLVAAIFGLYFGAGIDSFNIDKLASVSQSIPYASLVAMIFLIAFAVKTPLFPFHAWLPDVYCEASLSGTILLSALLSKAGIYGILRIGGGLFPNLMKEWSPILLGFAIAGTLYGAIAAWQQKDSKRLIAYSSLSHVNLILAGLFAWNSLAHTGAILQSFNHSISIAALFIAAAWIEERMGSRLLNMGGGLAKFYPCLCWLTLLYVLSAIALPGTNTFVGELITIFGVFSKNPWAGAILSCSIVLAAIYMLRWMQKLYFGQVAMVPYKKLDDLSPTEWTIGLSLAGLILWVGIYPAPLLEIVKQAGTQ